MLLSGLSPTDISFIVCGVPAAVEGGVYLPAQFYILSVHGPWCWYPAPEKRTNVLAGGKLQNRTGDYYCCVLPAGCKISRPYKGHSDSMSACDVRNPRNLGVKIMSVWVAQNARGIAGGLKYSGAEWSRHFGAPHILHNPDTHSNHADTKSP